MSRSCSTSTGLPRVTFRLGVLAALVAAASGACTTDTCDGASAAGCYCDAMCGIWGDCCADKVAVCGEANKGEGKLRLTSVMSRNAKEYTYENWMGALIAAGLSGRDAGGCAKGFTNCVGRGCYGECVLPCEFKDGQPAQGCFSPEPGMLDWEYCSTSKSDDNIDCALYPSVCCGGLSKARYNGFCGSARVGCICDDSGNGQQLITLNGVTATGDPGCIVACQPYTSKQSKDVYYVAVSSADAPQCAGVATSAVSRHLRAAEQTIRVAEQSTRVEKQFLGIAEQFLRAAEQSEGEEATAREEEKEVQLPSLGAPERHRGLQSSTNAYLTVFSADLTTTCTHELSGLAEPTPGKVEIHIKETKVSLEAIITAPDSGGATSTQSVSLQDGSCIFTSEVDPPVPVTTAASFGSKAGVAYNVVLSTVGVVAVGASVVATMAAGAAGGSGLAGGAAVRSLTFGAVLHAQKMSFFGLIDTGDSSEAKGFREMSASLGWTNLWLSSGLGDSCSGDSGLSASVFLGNTILILVLLPALLLLHLAIISAVEAHWLATDTVSHRRRESQWQLSGADEAAAAGADESGSSRGSEGGDVAAAAAGAEKVPGSSSARASANSSGGEAPTHRRNRSSMSAVSALSGVGGEAGDRRGSGKGLRDSDGHVGGVGVGESFSKPGKMLSKSGSMAKSSKSVEFHPDNDDPLEHIKTRSESVWVHMPYVELMFLVVAFTGGALAQVSALTSPCWWIRLLGTIMWVLLPMALLIVMILFMYNNVLGPARSLCFIYEPEGAENGGEHHNNDNDAVPQHRGARAVARVNSEAAAPSSSVGGNVRGAASAAGGVGGNVRGAASAAGGVSVVSGSGMTLNTAVSGWRRGWTGEEPSILGWAERGHWEERYQEDVHGKSMRIGFEPLYVDFHGEWAVVYFAFVLLKLMSVAIVLAVCTDGLVASASLLVLYGSDLMVQIIFRPYNNVVVGVISLVVTFFDNLCLVLMALVTAGIIGPSGAFQACMLLQLLGISVISLPIYLDTISKLKFWQAHRNDGEEPSDASGSGAGSREASYSNRDGGNGDGPIVAAYDENGNDSDAEDYKNEDAKMEDVEGAVSASGPATAAMAAGSSRNRASWRGSMRRLSVQMVIIQDKEHRKTWQEYWGRLFSINFWDTGNAFRSAVTRNRALPVGPAGEEAAAWQTVGHGGRKGFLRRRRGRGRGRERFRVGPKSLDEDDSDLDAGGERAEVPAIPPHAPGGSVALRSVTFDPTVVRSMRSLSGGRRRSRSAEGNRGDFLPAEAKVNDLVSPSSSASTVQQDAAAP